ncbi:hypothetical protein KBZ08_00915 [Cyanobium sp. Candia 9D4]|uniref:hypothetical protein n=1 Tax=Cyanobium sp. Candia 9D4 TaxID=2823707 RepID=UPI0020CC79ED|nr:hypothetical protein [Cyanobium sp. Candia 9D4]MCP9932468.1 hypothetical protein [Cyanobium sp. Candia 9D4]
MSTCEFTSKSTYESTLETPPIEVAVLPHANATEALHLVKELARRDPQFAAALSASDSPQAAADLAQHHGIEVSAAALWRHRGTLVHGGLPTWRG